MKKYRGVFLKNANEAAVMREANRLVALALDEMEAAVRPGVPTMLFEEIARDFCSRHKVRPSFLGYLDFPFALCCSVNEEVVHGFPSDKRMLIEGDIVSFDFGVILDGFHGDSARTIGVGTVSEQKQKLMDVTRESLAKGIAAARVGNNLNDIGIAVQRHVEAHGFSVIRRFVGHGIGRHLHEKPEIPNYFAPGLPDLPLQEGMALAIEPMVATGSYEVSVLEDGWTAVMRDGGMSAHFEHTVIVGHDGPHILSLP
ncbi:MAG: type I methionyl aminopeptidase [Deltaproteobacteria bacterium]|nr:type I methionyl aminopeptidase [Deltaproteobacteria bacterium]